MRVTYTGVAAFAALLLSALGVGCGGGSRSQQNYVLAVTYANSGRTVRYQSTTPPAEYAADWDGQSFYQVIIVRPEGKRLTALLLSYRDTYVVTKPSRATGKRSSDGPG